MPGRLHPFYPKTGWLPQKRQKGKRHRRAGQSELFHLANSYNRCIANLYRRSIHLLCPTHQNRNSPSRPQRPRIHLPAMSHHVARSPIPCLRLPLQTGSVLPLLPLIPEWRNNVGSRTSSLSPVSRRDAQLITFQKMGQCPCFSTLSHAGNRYDSSCLREMFESCCKQDVGRDFLPFPLLLHHARRFLCFVSRKTRPAINSSRHRPLRR